MGSAALYHLARRGKRALGLERFDIPHEPGSPHGNTRNLRLAYFEGALAHGAVVRARERVLDWEETADGVLVETDRGAVEAERLVVTAGAWAQQVARLPPGLVVAQRQVLAWLQPSKPELFTPERFPVFNIKLREGHFYGLSAF